MQMPQIYGESIQIYASFIQNYKYSIQIYSDSSQFLYSLYGLYIDLYRVKGKRLHSQQSCPHRRQKSKAWVNWSDVKGNLLWRKSDYVLQYLSSKNVIEVFCYIRFFELGICTIMLFFFISPLRKKYFTEATYENNVLLLF